MCIPGWQNSLSFDSAQGNNAARASLTKGDETGWQGKELNTRHVRDRNDKSKRKLTMPQLE